MNNSDWQVYREYRGIFFRVRCTETGDFEAQVVDYYHYNPPYTITVQEAKKVYFYAWLLVSAADGNTEFYLLAAPGLKPDKPSALFSFLRGRNEQDCV
jgi:hypothetical protein